MSSGEYLFPHRLTRRDFVRAAGAATAGLSLAGTSRALAAEPVKIGSGHFTYTLDENWGRLPDGMTYGFGCAVVVDSQDRVYVTSRSQNPCVAVFDREGDLIETWSRDFADQVGYTTEQVARTAHGLYWSQEGGDEFFYFTENKPGCRVYKTDLRGKVLYEIGSNVQPSSTSASFVFDNPTDVAIAPSGDIYIVDGYGSQLVHRFDKNFTHIRTIGGRGTEHGKFQVCHGVWINTLGSEPEVYIADRVNNRLEVYSLELDYRRTVADLRLPCCFYQHADHTYIPELGARVTILDADEKVAAHLGDGSGVAKEQIAQHPDKFATPHALAVDSRGDLYVVEWLDWGRPRKFKHTPA